MSEPMGEYPDLPPHSGVAAVLGAANKITDTAQLAGRQAQAIKEIRNHLNSIDAEPFVTDAFRNGQISGEKMCAAVIAAVLERNGL